MKNKKLSMIVIVLLSAMLLNIANASPENEITKANALIANESISLTIASDGEVFPAEAAVYFENNTLSISYLGKSLSLDIQSIVLNKKTLAEFSEKYRPESIVVGFDKGVPVITFFSKAPQDSTKKNELIRIRQEISGETLIYYGVPPTKIMNSTIPLIYLVEHFYPERMLNDSERKNGKQRITAISKNNPNAEIIMKGLQVKDGGLKISRKSFMESEELDSEIDYLKKYSVSEMYKELDSLVIKISSGFFFDNIYDRGFKITGFSDIPLIDNTSNDYIEFSPENCTKFGFVFLPGDNYDIVFETKKFSWEGGFAFGIADLKGTGYNESLIDMADFVSKTNNIGLTPIIRIVSSKGTEKETAAFISHLRRETENKVSYFQIGDAPNLYKTNEGLDFSIPKDYANFVIELSKEINDSNVRLISASLSLGKEINEGETKRLDANEYLNNLLLVPEFFDSIAYWGSSAYDLEDIGYDYCLNASQIDAYKNQELCMDSIYGYRWELEKIKSATGKQFGAFITSAGYKTDQTNLIKTENLLQNLKNDPNVISASIFLANGWKMGENISWFDETNKNLTSFAYKVAVDVC